MPITPINATQFQQIRNQLNQNQTRQGVAEMYQQMRNYGHLYPNLAMGIVDPNNSSMAGSIAVEHLQRHLESTGKPRLSEAGLENVMVQMANQYVNQLENQFAERGTIYRDVSGREALTLHNGGFTNLGYGERAWTLYIPYTVMGDSFANTNFVGVLDAAGNSRREVVLSADGAVLAKPNKAKLRTWKDAR